ncbi:MAG TPA: tripartite tricarboxylate transporter substrate-binding protein [Gammaproteobacteria bacterium]|jgi:tripartite-type tricarboxylate transporter receptor subunit TctC
MTAKHASQRTFTALAVCVLTLVSLSAVTQAASVRDGTVTLIVPNSAGGLMARYAHMIAPYIAKHAGAEEVRVRIMTGGGNIRGTNYLWYAEPDGRTIGFTSIPSLILAQLSGSEAVRFDTTRLVYLGRAATEARVLTVGVHSGIDSAEALMNLDRPFVFPSQGTDEDFYSMVVLGHALGMELKLVMGYDGNADTAMAVIRGDGDGHITAWRASLGVIEAGDERPILTLGAERYPRYADVPTAMEVSNPESRPAVQAIVNMLDMHRGFFGPPGLDPEATAELRAAISAAFADPELIAESERQRMPLIPSDGETEQAKIAQITGAGAVIVPILQAALERIR